MPSTVGVLAADVDHPDVERATAREVGLARKLGGDGTAAKQRDGRRAVHDVELRRKLHGLGALHSDAQRCTVQHVAAVQ